MMQVVNKFDVRNKCTRKNFKSYPWKLSDFRYVVNKKNWLTPFASLFCKNAECPEGLTLVYLAFNFSSSAFSTSTFFTLKRSNYARLCKNSRYRCETSDVRMHLFTSTLRQKSSEADWETAERNKKLTVKNHTRNYLLLLFVHGLSILARLRNVRAFFAGHVELLCSPRKRSRILAERHRQKDFLKWYETCIFCPSVATYGE